MITTYAQLLVREYPSESHAEAGGFVDNIVEGTKRMRALLADLLTYSEIRGRIEEESAETVDLNEVLETVKLNLKAAIDESGAVITSDPLPLVKVHAGHFVPLFQNLIGNSIKYQREQPPRIHVSFREIEGHLQFAFADNGIGIEPQYHDKIFVAFKRLHGKKIPGTGIGLAICQRVVERYGGRIWVESKPGEGATFLFTLPNIAVSAAGGNA
jgi:light-regulated signal transduction histidine kinase (bacteriophytochrome)